MELSSIWNPPVFRTAKHRTARARQIASTHRRRQRLCDKIQLDSAVRNGGRKCVEGQPVPANSFRMKAVRAVAARYSPAASPSGVTECPVIAIDSRSRTIRVRRDPSHDMPARSPAGRSMRGHPSIEVTGVPHGTGFPGREFELSTLLAVATCIMPGSGGGGGRGRIWAPIPFGRKIDIAPRLFGARPREGHGHRRVARRRGSRPHGIGDFTATEAAHERAVPHHRRHGARELAAKRPGDFALPA